jgi:hypothetical protein
VNKSHGQTDNAASADGYIIPSLDETPDGFFEVHPFVYIGSVGFGEHVAAKLIRGDFRENFSTALF